jgi:hypothetical protein
MEDGNFYGHHGVDFEAVQRALRADIAAGRVVQGGSTITQQLAKNLFLTNDRTVWRKTQELFLALALERRFTKAQIVTLYVNSIDYGMGQHGITAAARYYFHTTPDRLTLAQGAVLVGLISSPPHVWLSGPRLDSGRTTALGRVAFWFPGRYTQAQLDAAQSVPLQSLIYPYWTPERRGANATIQVVCHGTALYTADGPYTIEEPLEHVHPLLAARLSAFCADAARLPQRAGVVGVAVLRAFYDRPLPHEVPGGDPGTVPAHAYGQAIDLCGFYFADGAGCCQQVGGSGRSAEKMARMAVVMALLRTHFAIVVLCDGDGSASDPAHFHCEVRAPRPALR